MCKPSKCSGPLTLKKMTPKRALRLNTNKKNTRSWELQQSSDIVDHHMDHRRHGSLDVSPLLVALLGVMGGALVVAMVHCLIIACCNDHIPRGPRTSSASIPVSQRQNVRAQGCTGQASSSGSFSNVQILVASNYNEEFKEEVCAVCLSEFKQGDEVRVLPECAHMFHVSCIDKWLQSHRNCPLCRAETLPSPRDLACSLPNSALAPFPPAELHGGS